MNNKGILIPLLPKKNLLSDPLDLPPDVDPAPTLELTSNDESHDASVTGQKEGAQCMRI